MSDILHEFHFTLLDKWPVRVVVKTPLSDYQGFSADFYGPTVSGTGYRSHLLDLSFAKSGKSILSPGEKGDIEGKAIAVAMQLTEETFLERAKALKKWPIPFAGDARLSVSVSSSAHAWPISYSEYNQEWTFWLWDEGRVVNVATTQAKYEAHKNYMLPPGVILGAYGEDGYFADYGRKAQRVVATLDEALGKAVRQGKAKAGKKPTQEKTETPAAPPVPDLSHTKPAPEPLISAPALDGLRLVCRMGSITVKRGKDFIGYASWLSSARDATGDEAVRPYLHDIKRALLGVRPTDSFTLAYDAKNQGFRLEKP